MVEHSPQTSQAIKKPAAPTTGTRWAQHLPNNNRHTLGPAFTKQQQAHAGPSIYPTNKETLVSFLIHARQAKVIARLSLLGLKSQF